MLPAVMVPHSSLRAPSMTKTNSTPTWRWRANWAFGSRSYWISGSLAPKLSVNHNSFLRLLKNKSFKEERMTKVALDAVGTSTTLESNKSQKCYSASSRPLTKMDQLICSIGLAQHIENGI